MWTSKIYLRWYKSFNTRYHGYIEESTQKNPWEVRNDEFFPFIEVPLDRRISTVVGANESGKSHLLSAMEKIFQGWSTAEPGEELYDIQHICRYCALDGLEKNAWPSIGLELRFADKEEYDKCVSTFDVTPPSTETQDSDWLLRVFIDGSREDKEFTSVFDHTGKPIGHLTKSTWFEKCKQTLPTIHFINSSLALSNEVHVQQLLDMYDGKKPSAAYDPLALHELASEFLNTPLEATKALDEATVTRIRSLKEQVSKKVLGPKGTSVKLETLLFDKILEIDTDTLSRIKQLGSGNRGYVERIIDEINHRLVESLDISQFWQEDDDFTLQLEYKGGFFYFLITDKTGAKYTFNERSSGLKYFLSYYIQAKAIKQSISEQGAIVLMDEPDSFLSAAAQHNLLQVFESLVDIPPDTGALQLIYTTHSPFMINRNFPQRIALVRKGDGSEGTQLVEGTATRRYEPVRSGLGIDCAETLFMGSMNVVLEGISDQKVLVASIQRFGNPKRVDELLDLNRVTFVSAGGVSNVVRLVEKSTKGAEKRPAVVVFLDGDGPGHTVAQELAAKKLLEKDFIATIDQVGLKPTWNSAPKELEDIVPPKMLAVAVCQYLKDEWNEKCKCEDIENALDDDSNGDTMAKRLVKVAKDCAGAEAKSLANIEIKSSILDYFVDCLVDTNAFEDGADLKVAFGEFEKNVREICRKLQELLSAAETRSRRDRLQKNVRLEIERFEKSHRKEATKADVQRSLQRIDDACTGSTEHARLARENVIQLRNLLDEKVVNAGEPVDIEPWLKRFRLLWDSAWRQEKSGWK